MDDTPPSVRCIVPWQYKGGLFKVATLGHWEVIATSARAMDEIRQAPDSVLSFIDYMNRVCYLLRFRFLDILLVPDCCLTMKTWFRHD